MSRTGKSRARGQVGAADVAAADDADSDLCTTFPTLAGLVAGTRPAPCGVPVPGDLEATTGIEPVWTDLQSAASPLRHVALQSHPI